MVALSNDPPLAWADDVQPTLARAAQKLSLFDRVAAAVRRLEADENVRQVIVSEPYGEIIVMDNAYECVALRIFA